MKILILGATGFIGRNIFLSLLSEHTVIAAGRRRLDYFENWQEIDFLKENNWDEILAGIDLIINAIGIMEGDYKKVQTDSAVKLFNACITRKIKVINISAIGAEKENPLTEFLRSKKIADSLLLNYDLGKVIYPGIVIGKDGRSSQMFAFMAGLPLVPILSNDYLPLIHITQLTHLIKMVVNNFDNYPKQIFALAEPERFSELLSRIKGEKVRWFKIPAFLVSGLFLIFPNASFGALNKNTFLLYKNFQSKDYKPIFTNKVTELIHPKEINPTDPLVYFVALMSLIFIWIWSGVSSLINYPESFKLMKELGAGEQLSVLAILSGSVLDIFLGMALIWKKHRRTIIAWQMICIAIYTGILSVGAPRYWIHPFGVLSKNIGLLALGYFLYSRREKNS